MNSNIPCFFLLQFYFLLSLAFESLKEGILTKCLAYFNKEWHTEVIVDAGPEGLGAVLVQVNPNDKSDRKVSTLDAKSCALRQECSLMSSVATANARRMVSRRCGAVSDTGCICLANRLFWLPITAPSSSSLVMQRQDHQRELNDGV
jgi:hypothetical protein